jgi:hypothetical protein
MMNITEKIRESLRIENIHRDPTCAEMTEYKRFMRLKAISIADLEQFVSVYAPGKPLREQPGMDVQIGGRVCYGGPSVRSDLSSLLDRVNSGHEGAYNAHIEYEMLHPFMDGNGRSGRMLWYWQMEAQAWGTQFAFLHTFYYQTLQYHEVHAANDGVFGAEQAMGAARR